MTESNGSAAPAPERYEEMPDWERRFRAPRVSLPDWAEDAPDQALFVSNATGTYELYAWDRSTGEQRQVTERANGTTEGVLSRTAPGSGGSTTRTATSSASGAASRSPAVRTSRLTPGLDPSYPAGLALSRDGRTAVVGRSTDEDGTTIHVARTGEPPSSCTATGSRRAWATCPTTAP